jgi:hypothetical protein
VSEGIYAQCDRKHGGKVCEDPSCYRTNAETMLHAAAPELLNAVKAILIQVCQGKVLERDACITQARAAYAKATGRSAA